MTSSYPHQPDVTNPSTDAPARAMDWFGLVQPFVISEESPLSSNARLVYCAMTLYAAASDRGGVRPSIATLVKHTALKRTTVKAALKELEAVGVAIGEHGRRQGHGGLAPTEYRLLDADTDRSTFIDDNGAWIKGGRSCGDLGRKVTQAPRGSDSDLLGGSQGALGVGREATQGRSSRDPGWVAERPGVGREATTISTSDQDQVAAPASSTTDQSKATPDARGSAEESLAKEERAGAAGDDTEGVSTGPAPRGSQPDPLDEPGDASLDNPDLPAEWQTLLVKIDDHLAAQLLPVLDCYWTHLVASGKPRYPDQLSAILSELIMLVQDRRVDQVIAGIEWTFGGSGCNAPHKAGAVRQYVTQRSDSHTVHRLAQEPDASEARQRVLQAQSPRRPRPTRAAVLAPSATEAAEKREYLARPIRQRLAGTAQATSEPDAPDAQPVAEATPHVESRSPELVARFQAMRHRASA